MWDWDGVKRRCTSCIIHKSSKIWRASLDTFEAEWVSWMQPAHAGDQVSVCRTLNSRM